MKYTFDNVTRLIITVIIVIAILCTINYLSSVLLPFLLGWLIAYLMHPLVNFIQHKMRVKRRGISIAIALIAVVAAITGIVFAVVPMVSHEMSKSVSLITKYANNMPNREQMPSIVTHIFEYLNNKVDFNELLKFENIEKIGKNVLPQVWNLLSSTWQVFAAVFVMFIIFLYTIFILLDYDTISNGFIKLIPEKYAHYVSELISDVEIGMNRYLRGQLLIAAIVGVMFAVGFKIIGLPMAITVGIFIGILNIVPYLQTLGLAFVPFLALLQSADTGQNFWFVALMCIVVFIVVQGIQDMVLVPKIMGKAMGLNPAVILLSLSVWGALLGFVGMIIALPFTTILVAYYKRYVLKEKSDVFTHEELAKQEIESEELS